MSNLALCPVGEQVIKKELSPTILKKKVSFVSPCMEQFEKNICLHKMLNAASGATRKRHHENVDTSAEEYRRIEGATFNSED